MPRLNLAVRSALGAGATAAALGLAEVDAFACGEPEAVRGLEGFGKAWGALRAAASAWLVWVLVGCWWVVVGFGVYHTRPQLSCS